VSPDDDIQFDHGRSDRIGLPEAVYAEGKSTAQLRSLVLGAAEGATPLLITRLEAAAHDALGPEVCVHLDFDPLSGTAFVNAPSAPGPERVAVVTAGTVDLRAAREATRTLAFHGVGSRLVADVGVAGIWRLLDRADEIARFPVVIAVAGMEGALFSVLAGLVPGVMIAVPTSNGYGVAEQGRLALHAALSSCAPGVVACNIDNGYGAACAALRVLRLSS
jgi:NCAIR mutase (PurE)-related protein